MQKLNLTQKEYKVLTWKDDVTGLENRIEGKELVIFYSAMPSYWEQRILLSDVADAIHDIYNCEDELSKEVVDLDTEIDNAKKVMQILKNCVTDKTLSKPERNQYYSDYLKIAKNLIILERERYNQQKENL